MKILLALLLSASACFPSVYFEGQDDMILGPDITAMDSLAACTVSAWIRQDTLTVNKCFLSKYDNDATIGLLFQSGAIGATNILFGFSGVNFVTTTTGPLVANKWFHVCGTFDNALGTSKHKVYVDGVSQALASTGLPDNVTSTGASTVGVRIGSLATVAFRGWNGYVEEARIYNRALSDQEILNLALSRTANIGAMDGLIVYFPLDDTPQGTLMDGLISYERVAGNNGVGDNGANNINLYSVAGTVLSRP